MLPGVCFSQISGVDFDRIDSDLRNYQIADGQTTMIFEDSSVCRFFVQNGYIDGPWKSFYPDGKLKAKGQFKNNTMTGKWKIFAPWGKRRIVLKYDEDENYRLRRVRTGFVKYPVIFGRGCVQYTAYGTTAVDSNIAPKAELHYKHGLKHGHVKEYSLHGQVLADYQFHEGLYHGKYLNYNNLSGAKLEANYEKGVPTGKWTFYNPGMKPRTIDYDAEPFRQRVPGRGFLNDREVLFNKRKVRVIHASLPVNKELFEPDSSGVSLYSMLNEAFIQGETVFYADEQLSEPVFPSTARPDLISTDLLTKKQAVPVMLVYSEYSFFSTQLSDIRNMPLVFSLVFSFVEDEKTKYVSTPYFYFPETFTDLSGKLIHGRKSGDLFLKILHNDYLSFSVFIQNLSHAFFYEAHDGTEWINESVRKELELINMTHDLWMYQTGVIY